MNGHLEIEKKYLIKYPNVNDLLVRGAESSEITQVYLLADKDVSERVRKRVYKGKSVFTHTVKGKAKGIARTEDEREISGEEYETLLLRADPECAPVSKTRYVLKENGFCYEVDVFPFWKDKAFLEIELENEDVEPVLPGFITVVEDVSCDRNYTNHALSRRLKNNLL